MNLATSRNYEEEDKSETKVRNGRSMEDRLRLWIKNLVCFEFPGRYT